MRTKIETTSLVFVRLNIFFERPQIDWDYNIRTILEVRNEAAEGGTIVYTNALSINVRFEQIVSMLNCPFYLFKCFYSCNIKMTALAKHTKDYTAISHH